MYCRFTPAMALPCFSWPVSSSAPTAIRLRRDLRAALSSLAAAPDSFASTNNMTPRRLYARHKNLPHRASQQFRTQLTLPY
jgi:hypothetical protein